MQLFLGFLILIVIVGMATRSFGWFSYLAIFGAAVVMAGAYSYSSAVW